MRVRPLVLWFAGSGILTGLGIVGVSVFAPAKGASAYQPESLAFESFGLLCLAGLVGLFALLFWCLFCAILSLALTRLRAKARA